MKIGSHVSITGGLIGAAKEAYSYNADTFMIYTGAPQNTKRKSIEEMKAQEGKIFMDENGISDIVVHAPYIINLAAFKKELFEASFEFLKTELIRTESLYSEYLVLHPGAYTKKSLEYGVNRIAEGINRAFDGISSNVCLCLETMAGKGTEVGSKFEELAEIIEMVDNKNKVGICFDTCHVHDSGYDIVNSFDDVMKGFDSVLGLDRLKVFHINGSLNERGAKKDRHANIGAGEDNPKGADRIGFKAIYDIVHSDYAKDKPLILETPWLDKKTNLYKQEISALRGNKEADYERL